MTPRPGPVRRGHTWTGTELAALQNPDLSSDAIARATGRTFLGVATKRGTFIHGRPYGPGWDSAGSTATVEDNLKALRGLAASVGLEYGWRGP